jgi:hypothetical protein
MRGVNTPSDDSQPAQEPITHDETISTEPATDPQTGGEPPKRGVDFTNFVPAESDALTDAERLADFLRLYPLDFPSPSTRLWMDAILATTSKVAGQMAAAHFASLDAAAATNLVNPESFRALFPGARAEQARKPSDGHACRCCASDVLGQEADPAQPDQTGPQDAPEEFVVAVTCADGVLIFTSSVGGVVPSVLVGPDWAISTVGERPTNVRTSLIRTIELVLSGRSLDYPSIIDDLAEQAPGQVYFGGPLPPERVLAVGTVAERGGRRAVLGTHVWQSGFMVGGQLKFLRRVAPGARAGAYGEYGEVVAVGRYSQLDDVCTRLHSELKSHQRAGVDQVVAMASRVLPQGQNFAAHVLRFE